MYTTNKNVKGAIFVDSEEEFWNLSRELYTNNGDSIVCFIPDGVKIVSREKFQQGLRKAKNVLKENKAELVFLGADVVRYTKPLVQDIVLANCFYTCGYITTTKVISSFKRRFYGSKSCTEDNLCFHVKTAVFRKNIFYHEGNLEQRRITFEQVYNRKIAHIS